MNALHYTSKLDWLVATLLSVSICVPFVSPLLFDRTARHDRPGTDDAIVTPPPAEPLRAAALIEQAELRATPPAPTETELSVPVKQASVRAAATAVPAESLQVADAAAADMVPMVAEPRVDIAAALPPAERSEFLDAVAEGEALLSVIGDGEIPGYACRITLSLLDRLTGDRLARIVVEAPAQNQLFIFDASSTRSLGSARLILSPADLAGFSARVVWLDDGDLPHAARAIASEFGFTASSLRTGFVLRSDLDQAVLSAQARAAQAAGLDLDDVAFTEGRFATAAGVPFSYRVARLAMRDSQRWISVSSPANDARHTLSPLRQGG